jgi:hypothetical protein
MRESKERFKRKQDVMKWKEGLRETVLEMQWVWMVLSFLSKSDQEASCGMMATFQILKGNSMLTALIA